MDILYLLIPLTILLITGAIVAFIWSVKNGQFDDLDSPAHRILFEDDADRMPPQKPDMREDAG